jgi:isopropylmalate/homocitrate/citramalate synthase
LRDGIQFAKTRMSNDDKVAWIVSLSSSGIREI